MPKKSISPLEELADKKPQSKKVLIDPADILSGMQNSYNKNVASGSEILIKKALETPKNDKSGPDTTKTILSDIEQNFRRKQQKLKRPQNKEVEEFEKTLRNNIEGNSPTKEASVVSTESIPPIQTEIDDLKRENEKKAERVHELLMFVDEHRDSIIEKIKAENKNERPNIDRISELERKIAMADYRIKTLNKVRIYFLNPSKENALTKQEWKESERVREEVRAKMAEEETNTHPVTKVAIETKSKNNPVAKLIIETKPKGTPTAKVVSEIKTQQGPIITKPTSETKKKLQVETPRPLKTHYETAIERADKMNSDLLAKKSINSEPLKNLNTASEENTQEALIERIEKTKNFEELLSTIEKIDGLQSSDKWFSRHSLLGRINLVRAQEVSIDYIPMVAGLRKKVESLLGEEDISSNVSEKSKSNILLNTEESTPPPLETEKIEMKVETKDTPATKTETATAKEEVVPTDKETQKEKEEAFRLEIRKIFEEKANIALKKLSISRASYGQQIRIKTQHEHTQTRIGSLMSKLLRPFSKKPSINTEEYERTKKEYEVDLDLFKTILNKEDLNSELLEKAGEFGDDGLKIIQEEKNKQLRASLLQILITEHKIITDYISDSLSEKDRSIVSRLMSLQKKSSEGSKSKLQEIFYPNIKENA